VNERYDRYVAQLRQAVLRGSGVTAAALRQAVESRTAVLGGRLTGKPAGELPAEVLRFVDKIAQRAFEVTDEDVNELRRAGYSEDAIFEITASAALGAGVGRLERAMAALSGGV
jgi:alkylhydroperoxidase family enzyme